MKAEALNRWLTLGANIGVLAGLLLLVAELNQNSTLMRAQIFNERANQGIDQFMTIAESPGLSEITAILRESNWPDDPSAFYDLTTTQQSQYRWYLRADRFRIENLLYQQILGILENDTGPVRSGHRIVDSYAAMGEEPGPRLKGLIAEVEVLHQQEGS